MPNRTPQRAPEWPFRINTQSAQARGLVHWWPHTRGFSVDVITREPAVHSAGPWNVGRMGRWGPVIELEFANSQEVQLLANGAGVPLGPCSITFHVRFRGIPETCDLIGIESATLAERGNLNLFGTDALNFDWGWGGGGTRLTAAGTTFNNDPAVYVLTTGSRGMEIWRNGQLLASNGTNAVRTTSANAFKIGKLTANPTAEFGDIRVYNYQLPPNLCYDLWAGDTRWDLYAPVAGPWQSPGGFIPPAGLSLGGTTTPLGFTIGMPSELYVDPDVGGGTNLFSSTSILWSDNTTRWSD